MVRALRSVAGVLAAAISLTQGVSVLAASEQSPGTPYELACRLSPDRNPHSYLSWWAAVVDDAQYQSWFWNEIVPFGTQDRCRAGVQRTFWERAVPENWAPVPDIGGWPWERGGYYTQTFWLRAVPENWAPVPDIGGWPWATGGYFTQNLWLHAVPDNWGLVADIGGWKRPGGYYRQWFWLHAVPDQWAAVPHIGGWTGLGGYYTQWFWLHAVPDDWAPSPQFVIDGRNNKGSYNFWFYHFASARDLARRDGPAAGEAPEGGYYDTEFRRRWGLEHPHYIRLLELAGGYLKAADQQGALLVDNWFAPDARAVVIFTFDMEGTRSEACALTNALRAQGIPATFFLVGTTVQAIARDPEWKRCLRNFDIGNHTQTHLGTDGLVAHGLLAAFPDADQIREITAADASIRRVFGPVAADSFRTPWTDGRKAFDASVARNLLAQTGPGGSSIIKADSSIATVSGYAVRSGFRPSPGLAHLFLQDFPYPFTVQTGPNGAQLTEFPFSYPSDWAAGAILHLDSRSVPSSRDDPGYAVNLWKDIFDGVVQVRGMMVLAMHPWIQAGGGRDPEGLRELIAYMKSTPGVYFSDMHEAAQRFRSFATVPRLAETSARHPQPPDLKAE